MGQLTFVFKTVLRGIFLLICVSFITFILMLNSPIDPVSSYIGADILRVSPEQIEKISEYWGVGASPLTKYSKWIAALLHGNFGVSLIFRRPVIEIIREKFLGSFLIMASSLLFSSVIGYFLGIFAAFKQNKLADKLISGYCVAISSVPVFWLAIVFVMVFSVKLGWFPLNFSAETGLSVEEMTFSQNLYRASLPIFMLSILGVSNIALNTREKAIDILNCDYILFARSRGEFGISLFFAHVLRNSLAPLITISFAAISDVFGGAILAEQIFSYPGLGQTAVLAGLRGDTPLLLGIVLFVAVFVFIGNLTANLLLKKV